MRTSEMKLVSGSGRPTWTLSLTSNSHININFVRSGRNIEMGRSKSCKEYCGGDIASLIAILIARPFCDLRSHSR